MLLGVCAVLMAVAVANAAEGQVASVVVGLARCADCTRKNMKAEAAIKGKHAACAMPMRVLCMLAMRYIFIGQVVETTVSSTLCLLTTYERHNSICTSILQQKFVRVFKRKF